MLCWGSWGNTQKLASKTWRYEFFYWDYVIGVLLFSVFSAFTLGSFGSEGQGFLLNLPQADMRSLGSAFLGGIIFNAANILLSAAIAICGLSVAFPVGIGLAPDICLETDSSKVWAMAMRRLSPLHHIMSHASAQPSLN